MQLNYARVRLYDLLGEVEAVARELAANTEATEKERGEAHTQAVNARYARLFWRTPAATEKPPVRTDKATETTKETPNCDNTAAKGI